MQQAPIMSLSHIGTSHSRVPPFPYVFLDNTASSADRRFCGPRFFRSSYRHRALFYRGVETPASFSFRPTFLYRRAPAQAAREIHRA
jgi:hypothetical protein